MGDRTLRFTRPFVSSALPLYPRRGIATGRPGTEARGAGEELKGKAKNAVGRTRSAAKKATR
jgi:hypothetical protein